MHQFLPLVVGEARFRVQQRVFGGGHITVINLLADVFPSPHHPIRMVVRPVGKIHVPAAALDVACNQPGHRRNAAVPRPFGFVRMTIVTRRVQQRGDLWRRRVGGQTSCPGTMGGLVCDGFASCIKANTTTSPPKIHFSFFIIPLIGRTNDGKSSRPKQT